jgi:hypothetical protein
MKTTSLVTWETLIEVANLWEVPQRVGGTNADQERVDAFWRLRDVERLASRDPMHCRYYKQNKVEWDNAALHLTMQIYKLMNTLATKKREDFAVVSPLFTIEENFKFLPDNQDKLRIEKGSLGMQTIFRALLNALAGIPLWKIARCLKCYLFFSKKDKTTKYCSKCTKDAAQKNYYKAVKEEKIKKVKARRALKKDFIPRIKAWKERGYSESEVLKNLHNYIKRQELVKKAINKMGLQDETLIRWITETKIIKGGKKNGTIGKA